MIQSYFLEINDIDLNEKAKIVFAIANGIGEVYDLSKYYAFSYWYNGVLYAVQRSNLLQEILQFLLQLFPNDCGNFFYDPTWYTLCLLTM